ncbi:MAG: mechanosensitive ion channel [Myxococcales bacterium]|nr:mechanosensitive ion channel [Myxococcales bacterium]MCB9567047.1 mechanosensitive ion channel [Myxococcales bacterium]MCB9704114.1 mechanosensitive ion channel [Myxococcales bacterium]
MSDAWLAALVDLVPALVTALIVVIGLLVARRALDRLTKSGGGPTFRGDAVMLALTAVGLVLIVVMLPITEGARTQILSVLGILLSATIALSSTTFLGNAMAGLMLRALRNFRPGDFVRVGEHFGRVSERGIFHTEIQTEDRDLTTLPNLLLVNQPVTVIRSSGTILSATVSLGYDVQHAAAERALLAGAGEAGLHEPFVHVMELGDFSVTYRVAGLLTEVRQILTARSRLRVCMLDALHSAGIEIVSPDFLNLRRLEPSRRMIPSPARVRPTIQASDPEGLAFDKAEEAASLEHLRDRQRALGEELERLRGAAEAATEEDERARLRAEVERLEARERRIGEIVDALAES